MKNLTIPAFFLYMQNKIKQLLSHPFLWLFVLLVITFWQVAFLYSGLHWDMLDVHLPWLHYMAEVLQSGELHYWNPYQQLGYPFHADMLSTWYPPSLFTAKFIGFNLYVLHYYFLLHLLIAGIGMYKLSLFFNGNTRIAFLGAVSYMMCGVAVSNAQHLFIVISLAWLPFVLYYFLRTSSFLSFIDVFKLALVTCFIITGGYPFLTVVLIYFLLILLLIIILKNIKQKKKDAVRILFLFSSGTILTLAMCAPMIIAFIQVFPVLERGSPLSAETALSFPYTLHALWLNLIPFALGNNAEFFGTDISMINIYAGIILPVFFVYGLFRKASLLEYVLVIFGTFCLVGALSSAFPLMKWMVMYVPLFNFFRFPALLRLFFVMGFIIFSLRGLHNFLKFFNRDKKLVVYCLMPFIAFISFFILYAVSKIDFPDLTFLKPHATFQDLLLGLTLNERILIGGVVQLVVLLIFLVILFKTKNSFSFFRNLIFLFVFDMFISVQMNINYTVVDPVVVPIKTERALESIIPKGFPIPKRTSMVNAKNEGTTIPGIWRNVNDFTKEPAVDGFSSFWLNDYLLLENDTLLGKQVLDNPIVYLSPSVFSFKDLELHKKNGEIKRKDIYLSDADLRPLQSCNLSHSRTDTAYFQEFGPNKFRIKVSSSGNQVLTLLQSNYKGWKVSISGKDASWFKSNYLFMSVLIPQGEYEVVFRYENLWIKCGFIVAAVVFALVLMMILFLTLRKRNKSGDLLINQ